LGGLGGLGGFGELRGFGWRGLRAEKGRGAQIGRVGSGFGLGDEQVGNLLDDPVKIFLANRMQIGVGDGIHEVDGVGNAAGDGELDGIEVVAEGAAEGDGVSLDALEEFFADRWRAL